MAWRSSDRGHAAVIRAFHDQFVPAGVFPAELHVAFAKAFSERGVSDYDYERRVTDVTARRVLDDATRFVDAVEAYLRRIV